MVEENLDLAKPPHCKDVTQWIVASENDMPPIILCNAWKRYDLSYFPLEKKEFDEKGFKDDDKDGIDDEDDNIVKDVGLDEDDNVGGIHAAY